MKRYVIVMAVILLCASGVGILFLLTGFRVNHPSKSEYPVRGVDVSSYQGVIDWAVLSKQNIQFAYIKATEGSGSTDVRFAYNWGNAQKTTLKIGAYHFFSFDSGGATQAENFITTIPQTSGTLPPAVDIELYGKYLKAPPDSKAVRRELTILLDKLEKQYGMKPVIYATMESYDCFLKGFYTEYPIWIRNVLSAPSLSDRRKWMFWQYTHRAVCKGYRGKEKYIDMNVFNGTQKEFDKLIVK